MLRRELGKHGLNIAKQAVNPSRLRVIPPYQSFERNKISTHTPEEATGFVAHDYWYTFGVQKIDSMTVTCHQNAKNVSGEVMVIDFNISSRETPIRSTIAST